ncbi:hypothetical protein DS878_14025 [Marinobacter sp. F3R11]|nr:hypothetical protein DS878_14025 [Marinobacter sp. F3R11]
MRNWAAEEADVLRFLIGVRRIDVPNNQISLDSAAIGGGSGGLCFSASASASARASASASASSE